MTEFRKILFPLDLSGVSPKIAPWVLTLAKRFNAEIHLLFVARRLEHLSGLFVTASTITNFQDEIIEGAQSRIKEFASIYCENYSACKTSVVLGDAAEEILRYVESNDIDMVIMGTHGRKGLERVLFGSVAERVVKMSSAPVLTINPYRIKAT